MCTHIYLFTFSMFLFVFYDTYGYSGGRWSYWWTGDCLIVTSIETSQRKFKFSFEAGFQSNLFGERRLPFLGATLKKKKVRTESLEDAEKNFIVPMKNSFKNLLRRPAWFIKTLIKQTLCLLRLFPGIKWQLSSLPTMLQNSGQTSGQNFLVKGFQFFISNNKILVNFINNKINIRNVLRVARSKVTEKVTISEKKKIIGKSHW